MSLYLYFKAKEGLLHPSGSLSSLMSSRAIALANKEVRKAVDDGKAKKKCGPCIKYVFNCMLANVLS